MNDSNDIANLFKQFGGDPLDYQETSRLNEASHARARWAVLAAIDPLLGARSNAVQPREVANELLHERGLSSLPTAQVFDTPIATGTAEAAGAPSASRAQFVMPRARALGTSASVAHHPRKIEPQLDLAAAVPRQAAPAVAAPPEPQIPPVAAMAAVSAPAQLAPVQAAPLAPVVAIQPAAPATPAAPQVAAPPAALQPPAPPAAAPAGSVSSLFKRLSQE
jgi:hypothetical protein